jgi:hypothetical protein
VKPTPQDLVHLAAKLREFLETAGWTSTRQSNGMTFYAPPEALGIRGKYRIAIPNETSRQGVTSLLHGAANSLVDLYGFASVGDLLDRAATFSEDSKPTRIVTRFIDETTRKGAVPLRSIVEFSSNMEDGLYRIAKFKLGGDTKETKLIAQKFAKECVFLQTEEGSFIAKVEIPQSILKQADLFGGEALASAELCSSFFSGIQFLNERIANDEVDFDSPEILGDAIALFDVEVLESLTKIVVNPEMDTMDFSMEVGTQVRTTSTGVLTGEKTARLKDFLEFVREQLRGENDLDVSGPIIELRSRDPEGSKNYIRVLTQFRGDRTFVSAILTNEQYALAVDAHRNKRQVRLKGSGIRLKTQIRVPAVTELTVI